MKRQIRKLFLFLLLFTLLANIFYAYDYYTIVDLKSQKDTVITLSGVYLCKDSSCSSVIGSVNAEMYDYSKVNNCFNEYNIENIDSCVSEGYLGNSVQLNAGEEKLVVLKIETPDKGQHYFDAIFNPNNQVFYTDLIPVNDWSNYNVNYLNDVYWYKQGKYNPGILEFKPVDLNNEKGVVISYFDISNKVEVKQPLFIEVPAELNSAICSELKKATPYYVPEDVLDIKTKVSLTITDSNGNIIYTDSKDLLVNPDYCNVNYNFQWVPQEVGSFTVTLKAEIVDERVINALSDQAQQEIEVFDPNQQFCYTNLKNIKLSDLDSKDSWTLESDEAIKLSFDVLSGENDGEGTITPKQTYWEVFVDGVKIDSGVESDTYDYKNVLVDLTNKLSEGQHTLTIKAQASDCSYENNQEATFSKTINILADDDNDVVINHPPEILNFQIDKTEGESPLTITFSFQVYDEDSDPLTVDIAYNGCLTDGCNYEEVNVQSGQTIEKTYTYNEPGTYILKIKVSDGNKFNILEKTIIVKDGNIIANPPEIQEFNYSWNDLDNDNLIDTNEEINFTAKVNCQLNCNATFSLFDLKGNIIDQKTLSVEGEQTLDLGKYTLEKGQYKAELSLDDGNYNTYKFLTFTVVGSEDNNEINNPPTITTNVNEVTANVGEKVVIDITAQDKDNDLINLQLSLVNEDNTIVDYYTQTGKGTIEYTYTKTFENEGNYILVIEAEDSYGHHVSKNVQITILKTENNGGNNGNNNIIVVDDSSKGGKESTDFTYTGSPVDLTAGEEMNDEEMKSTSQATLKEELNKLLSSLTEDKTQKSETRKVEKVKGITTEIVTSTKGNNNQKILLIGVAAGISLLLLLLLLVILLF
jgi:hypothetical protein